MPAEGEIECCPFEDCRSSRFRTNSESMGGREAAAAYWCKDCGRSFETPDTRVAGNSRDTRSGIAGKLADPDVSEPSDLDELRADGGEA